MVFFSRKIWRCVVIINDTTTWWCGRYRKSAELKPARNGGICCEDAGRHVHGISVYFSSGGCTWCSTCSMLVRRVRVHYVPLLRRRKRPLCLHFAKPQLLPDCWHQLLLLTNNEGIARTERATVRSARSRTNERSSSDPPCAQGGTPDQMAADSELLVLERVGAHRHCTKQQPVVSAHCDHMTPIMMTRSVG